MAFLELHDIVKSFGKNTVVKGLSLKVEKGEFVSLLGGSGCGKTTTLRMIAGFETQSSGTIHIDGEELSAVPPNKRNLGMVFQNYALFPNMTVGKNIAFGLSIAGKQGPEVASRVEEMLEMINMAEFSQRYPHQLSGGQQQRVALARAIAIAPRALLLDEPLSALDAKIRVKLRDEIRKIQRQLGITTIYVTHDQEEALSISDRVAVMRDGLIEQIGAPFEIYNRPATSYVASFIGTLNVLSAKIVDPEAGSIQVEGQTISTGRKLEGRAGDELSLSLRPEALSLDDDVAGARGVRARGVRANGVGNFLEGEVVNIKLLGSIVRLMVAVGTRELSVDAFNDPRRGFPGLGQRVRLGIPPEALILTKPDASPTVDDIEEEDAS
ncbi:MAG: ABC transporter ATP-binding protein [Spirochaetota bacterium]